MNYKIKYKIKIYGKNPFLRCCFRSVGVKKASEAKTDFFRGGRGLKTMGREHSRSYVV